MCRNGFPRHLEREKPVVVMDSCVNRRTVVDVTVDIQQTSPFVTYSTQLPSDLYDLVIPHFPFLIQRLVVLSYPETPFALLYSALVVSTINLHFHK